MRILGISSLDNDATAALYDHGRLTAIAEERLTRVKLQSGFPGKAVQRLLNQAGLTAADVDHVAYPFMPWYVEGWRILSGFSRDLWFTGNNGCTRGEKSRHIRAYFRWQYQAIRNHRRFHLQLEQGLKEMGFTCPLQRIEHHHSHVCSAYFSSGFQDALALTFDWYGGGLAGSVVRCSESGLETLQEFTYPHSLGLFYAQVTKALGFRAGRHEGKIVGLAAHGDPAVIYGVLARRFAVEDGNFQYRCGMDPQLAGHLAREYSREDVAAAYQLVLEEIAARIAAYWLQKTGLRKVVLAGGVAANVKMNQRIAGLDPVDAVFIHPNMGDGGTAVGAIFAELYRRKLISSAAWETCYLGPEFTEDQLKQALQNAGIRPLRPQNIAGTIAELLAGGKIVARFDGAMEYGPRALGNRSILYPATDPAVNTWLNQKLGRTEFMPFAPLTLIEHCDTRFTNIRRLLFPARFMTITCDCTELMRRESPAAVHVDGTARPQILSNAENPGLHDILTAYYEMTGIPTVINTSFNMHEEPIVCTPEDAIRAFRKSKLDYLALGPFLIAGDHETN